MVDNFILMTVENFKKAEVTKLHGSKSSLQYGCQRGIREFGDLGWEATKQESDQNLLGKDAVRMVKRPNVKHDLVLNALSYLSFLKQKQTGLIKAR